MVCSGMVLYGALWYGGLDRQLGLHRDSRLGIDVGGHGGVALANIRIFTRNAHVLLLLTF